MSIAIVAELAAHLFDVSVALVTFIDTHRQWHKAAVGTDRTEIPRERSLCAATIEADLVTRSGSTVPILFTGVRTYLEGAFHLVGMGTDISEQRRQARALREAKEKAEEASRIKSRMLKNLSHEIRTPLTSIIGFARVLKENLSGEDGRAARLVHEAGKRLKGTVDSVLQLSKLETGTQDLNRERLDLGEVPGDVAGRLRPHAESKE